MLAIPERSRRSARTIAMMLALGVQAPAMLQAVDRRDTSHGDSVPVLTVDDAVREAVRKNRDLRTAALAIALAEGRLRQAGLWPNPAVGFGGNHDFAFANEGEYSASAGFEQRFPVAGRIARAKDVARVDVALAIAEVQDAARRLIGDVESAFFGLVVLGQQIAERDHLATIAGRLTDASAARLKLAEVSPLDANTARIEQERLSLERAQLVAQRRAREAELNRLLGRTPDAPIPVRGDLTPAALEALGAVKAEAIERRPDLRQASLQADRARAEQALAKAERWEDWTVGLSYDRDRQVIDGAPRQRADQFLGLRVSVPLPVLNRNEGRIAEAVAQEAQATSRRRALELAVFTDVEAAYRRMEELARVVKGYRDDLIPLADRNVALAQDAYRSGLKGITEVVQVQRQQSELRTAYLDALGQYRRAAIDLKVAAATSPLLNDLEALR